MKSSQEGGATSRNKTTGLGKIDLKTNGAIATVTHVRVLLSVSSTMDQ